MSSSRGETRRDRGKKGEIGRSDRLRDGGGPDCYGLIADLSRPGGNVAGLSNQATDLAGKRLALLREVIPGLRRLAIMANVGYPGAVLEIVEIQAAAGMLGLEAAP